MLNLCTVCLLLGLLLLSTATAVLCDESSYTTYYFELCLLDPACQANWNLYPDDFEVFDYLMITQLMQPREFAWQDVCEDCHEAQWLANLRVHRFCPPNYERYGDTADCRCRHEAQCDEIPPSGFRISDFGKIVFLVVTVVFVVYIGFNQLKELRRIHKKEQQSKPPPPHSIKPKAKLTALQRDIQLIVD